MRKIEIFFLLVAASFVIFLHYFYFREVCYDRDLGGYIYNALDLLWGKGWYYSTGHIKPPGIDLILLAAFNLFGQSFKSIYLAALFFNLSSLALIYLLAKLLLSKETKLYFLLPVFFVLFFAAEPFRTFSANTEVFLIPFEISGILFLGLNRYFLSGLLLGLGFLIRQTAFLTFFSGILFIIITCISLDRKPPKELIKTLLKFSSAFALPLIIISIYFLYKGVFDKFLNCTFIYNFERFGNYVTDAHPIDLPFTKKVFWQGFNFEIPLFGLFSLFGLFYSLVRRTKPRILISIWFIIISLWLLIAGIYPHHFISLIVPLACISLLGWEVVFNWLQSLRGARSATRQSNLRLLRPSGSQRRTVISIILTAALIIPYIRLIIPFVTKKRLAYSFQESEDRFYAAQYVKEHTVAQDKIFVWDNLSLGVILLWSGRDTIARFHEKNALLPPELEENWVPYRVNYRLNQEKLIFQLHKSQPKYIIVVYDYGQAIRWRKLINKENISIADWEVAKKEALESERKSFFSFFELLDNSYQLEKEIGICRIYRLIR